MRVLVGERAVRRLGMHEHRRIGLEHQDLAVGKDREIQPTEVQADPFTDRRHRRHRPGPDGGLRILQEPRLLRDAVRPPLHAGGVVMHHPLVGDGQVIGVGAAFHEEHAVLAVESVGGSEVVEGGHIV